MYEEAVNVPLIVRVPWLSAAADRVAGRISQIDVVPTLLDLLNQPIPEHVQGVSRVPVLQGEVDLTAPGADDVIIEWNGTEWRPPRAFEKGIPPQEWDKVRGVWRTLISTEGWKLNLSPIDQCELYDLNNDPYEQTNLFDDLRQRDRIRDLTERIRRWQMRTADDAQLPDL